VQFYEDDAVLLDGLSEYAAATLGRGWTCLVIATPEHRAGLEERLRGGCVDLPLAMRRGVYLALDAEETLAAFMEGGWPDAERFFHLMEGILLRAKVGGRSRKQELGAFGEMVALLWAQGKTEAAIRLEQLWNELAGRHRFRLHCAYPMKCFGSPGHLEIFEQICAEHTHVGPAESYTQLDGEEARGRMVSSLQRKAQAFDALEGERTRELERRQYVEEALRQTEAFAANVMENSVDCVKVLDLDGRISYMSPPGLRAMELDDIGIVLGKRWPEFWKIEDQALAETALRTALQGGVGHFQGLCATVSGIPKWWDVRISPVRDKQGGIERLIAISRDITELRRAQASVMQAEKLAATGRMAASIAHEINNPLEAVTNFIYLAKTTKGVPEEVCQHLEIADQELARVAQIAQQTLGFYRDSSRPKWISVEQVIDNVLTIYDRKLRYKHLAVERPKLTGVCVLAREGELKQVLSNLITNAIDASRDGGRLVLRTRASQRWEGDLAPGLRISVVDNGCGMSAEVQRRLFVPFFTTKADVGTGVGLWVAKNMIDSRGGSIRFRSRQGDGCGTVMTVFLPVRPSCPSERDGTPGSELHPAS
jgi:PAS domain S-box-containing protein